MPIFQTAHYQVEASAVEDVKAAIEEFVAWVAENEPGTKMYTAWEAVDDPTKFVHLFEFADEAAHQRQGGSDAVAKFESVCRPVLVGARWSSPTTARWRRTNHRRVDRSLSGVPAGATMQPGRTVIARLAR